MNEADLFRAYRVGHRTEPCACGGHVSGSIADSAALQKALDRHYATERHLAWRMRQGQTS